MAITEGKKIQHIVATSAQIAAGDFDGRLAYDTTEQAIRIRAGGAAKYAAMRGHTHTPGEVVGLGDDYVAKTGDAMTGDLTVSADVICDAVRTVRVTRQEGSGVGGEVSLGASGGSSTLWHNGVPVLAWLGGGTSSLGIVATNDLYLRGIYGQDGPGYGSINLQAAADTARLQYDGTTVLTWGKRGDGRRYVVVALDTSGSVASDASRCIQLTAQGEFVESPANTVLVGGVIAQSQFPNVQRELVIQPLPITNAAPTVVNVVDANMKSFGFDGATQVEELYYHIDVQHDYVPGTDVGFHAHWMPATAAGGNVRFQVYYQWVEGGGTFPAATLVAPAAVAAGTTAWADKRTDFVLSGAGHTYNSRIMIRLFRDPTDGTDTYGGDAVLSSVGAHYTANPAQAG